MAEVRRSYTENSEDFESRHAVLDLENSNLKSLVMTYEGEISALK